MYFYWTETFHYKNYCQCFQKKYQFCSAILYHRSLKSKLCKTLAEAKFKIQNLQYENIFIMDNLRKSCLAVTGRL